MKQQRANQLVTAASLILIGLMFVIFKSDIISIAMSLIGVALIVMGVFDIIRKNFTSGVIKLALAVLVLAAGWLFVKLALYLLAAFLLIVGSVQLYGFFKLGIKEISLPVLLHLAQPAIYVLVGICLFFNQGGALAWVFTVSGIFFIVDGALALIGAFEK